jgi:hypothetical protein
VRRDDGPPRDLHRPPAPSPAADPPGELDDLDHRDGEDEHDRLAADVERHGR